MLLAIAGGIALVLLAAPTALGDAIANVAPASQVSGLATEFPLGNYVLDSHFSAVSVGVFSGVNVSGVPAMIAYFLANTLWQLTAFLANAVITLFTFAFSLDLVNGSAATGGAGALAPVASAVHTIYHTIFGAPWLAIAVVLTGLWAMWRALVQRRYVETFGALGMSLIYVVIALAFVTEPQATIGTASKWTNELSTAFLSLTSHGNLADQRQAKQADADQLFDVLVYQPWVVLQFGGLEHCVRTGTSSSVAVQPLTARQSQALADSTEIRVGERTCINNANKYAAHFLRYSPDNSNRTDEYTALAKGDNGDLPSSDPSKAAGSYKLGPADEPAAAAMGEGGQYQRLLLAVVIFAGECGAFLLLGGLSVAVILAQVILLLLLAFAPVALVIAVFPGRGHEFFIGWLTRLATFLLRKAVYSLILAVLLAVAAALESASADLGWLLSFGLEAAFFWAVFLYRHQLTSRLSLATTGHGGTEDQALKFATLYALSSRLRHNLSSGSMPSGSSGQRQSSNGTGGPGSNPPSHPDGPAKPAGSGLGPAGNPPAPAGEGPAAPAASTTGPTETESAAASPTESDDQPATPALEGAGVSQPAQGSPAAGSATGSTEPGNEAGVQREPSASYPDGGARELTRPQAPADERSAAATAPATSAREAPTTEPEDTAGSSTGTAPTGAERWNAAGSQTGSAAANTDSRQPDGAALSPLAASVRQDLHRLTPARAQQPAGGPEVSPPVPAGSPRRVERPAPTSDRSRGTREGR